MACRLRDQSGVVRGFHRRCATLGGFRSDFSIAPTPTGAVRELHWCISKFVCDIACCTPQADLF